MYLIIHIGELTTSRIKIRVAQTRRKQSKINGLRIGHDILVVIKGGRNLNCYEDNLRNFLKELENRKRNLLKITQAALNYIKKAPSGYLRVNCTPSGKFKYYRRDDPSNKTGHYIPKKDFAIAQSLAQKDYYTKLIQVAKKEIGFIDTTLDKIPEVFLEDVYGNLHLARQKLISPIIEPDDVYIKMWESLEYVRKPFDLDFPDYRTEKNERVRSKSEIFIADLLTRMDIPYRYECPLKLNSIGSPIPNLTIYPDFTLLDIRTRKEVYLEHFGMMDNPEYAEKAILKIATYESNGIYVGKQLIVTYETAKQPFNPQNLKKKLSDFFND